MALHGAPRLFAVLLLTGFLDGQRSAEISIQIINPEASLALRVVLDRKVVYERAPEPSAAAEQATVPARVGPLAISAGLPHSLIAEVPGKKVKAELIWTSGESSPKWIVIRYHPGRPEDGEPPFFQFALQQSPASLK